MKTKKILFFFCFAVLTIALLATVCKHLWNEARLGYLVEIGLAEYYSPSVEKSKQYDLFLREYTVKFLTVSSEFTKHFQIKSAWMEKRGRQGFDKVWFHKPTPQENFSLILDISASTYYETFLLTNGKVVSTMRGMPAQLTKMINLSAPLEGTIELVVQCDRRDGTPIECFTLTLEPVVNGDFDKSSPKEK